jgi:hypothetical protein
MTAKTNITGANPPGIEGLKAANTLTAQVITVAAGLLAFTVTFAEKFTPAGKPIALPTALKASWLCFAATIVFGFLTLMAVAGTLLQIDRGDAETNLKRTNIKMPALIMLALFLAGVISLMIAGWSIGT